MQTLLYPLQKFRSCREAFVVSTSQNLLFIAIRSGSGGHNGAAIRQTSKCELTANFLSFIWKSRNSACLQNQRDLHRMESLSSRRLAGCLSGWGGWGGWCGVRASRTKMRVFGWLPKLPGVWMLHSGGICSKVMSPCFPTHWPLRGDGRRVERNWSGIKVACGTWDVPSVYIWRFGTLSF